MPRFSKGDTFPALAADSVSHGHIRLPDDIPADNWAVVLTYRAHW